MRTCVLFLVCPLPLVLCSLPRLTVLLPALPDVHLSAQREVQVQPPVRRVPVCFVGFPIAHLSFVCLSHGGGSLAPVSQNHAEQDVDSELAFQLRSSYRRWIAKPCLGARFRATAVIREHAHIASTTESASWHTDAVSLFTGPATDWIGSVPAYWDQSGAAYSAYPGSVPASWEQ